MKTLIISFAAALAINTLGYAQPQAMSEKRQQKAYENYADNLRQENDGVVESSMYYLIKFAYNYGKGDMHTIELALFDAASHKNPKIRMKAFVTMQVVQDHTRLPNDLNFDDEHQDDLFKQLIQHYNGEIRAIVSR